MSTWPVATGEKIAGLKSGADVLKPVLLIIPCHLRQAPFSLNLTLLSWETTPADYTLSQTPSSLPSLCSCLQSWERAIFHLGDTRKGARAPQRKSTRGGGHFSPNLLVFCETFSTGMPGKWLKREWVLFWLFSWSSHLISTPLCETSPCLHGGAP